MRLLLPGLAPGLPAGTLAGRFRRAAPLEGLDGPVGGLPLLGLTLGERQGRACLEAGLQLPPDGDPLPEDRPRLLIRDDAAISGDALKAFALALGDGRADLRFGAGGRVGNLLAELSFGDPDPLLVYLAPGGPDGPARRASAAEVKVDPKERLVEFPLAPGQFPMDVLELPLSERCAWPVGHWVQLLWANLLGLGPHLYRVLGGKNVLQLGWRLAGALASARSLDPGRVAGQYRRVGRGCKVHPSAVVEGSWLGDNVEIGPQAVVRGCVLADGAVVEALAIAEGCVLGAGARVQRQALTKFSVLAAGAHNGGDVQLAVLGRGAAVKRGAQLFDQAFDQRAKVRANGGLHPAPLGLIGVCVGAGTLVGAGVRVAPGRALPPGLQVVSPPRDVLRRVDASARGLHSIVDGALAPLTEGAGA